MIQLSRIRGFLIINVRGHSLATDAMLLFELFHIVGSEKH